MRPSAVPVAPISVRRFQFRVRLLTGRTSDFGIGCGLFFIRSRLPLELRASSVHSDLDIGSLLPRILLHRFPRGIQREPVSKRGAVANGSGCDLLPLLPDCGTRRTFHAALHAAACGA